MFYVGIVSFLFGVLLGLLYDFIFAHWFLLGGVISGVLILSGKFWKKTLVIIFLLIFGLTRGDSFVISILSVAEGEMVDIHGLIDGVPETKGDKRRYRVKIESITSETQDVYFYQKELYLYLPYIQKIDPGSQIYLKADIKHIKPFLTDTGRIFYYDRFLETKDIIGSVRYPKSLQVESSKDPPEMLIRIKQAFVERINYLFTFPNAPLLSGVLLGVVDTLGEKRLDDFRIAGLIHIVVLSGSNIAIIIEAVRRSIPLKRHASLFIAGFAIFFFVMMVGPEASIVRASIMAYIGLVAQATYSHYSVYRSLWLTIVIMVAWNPGILLYDPSFILSVLATMGMVYLNPYFEKKLTLVTERFECRFIIASTCATYIAVLPYLLYSMGMMSLVSLVVNLITLPLVPWVMLGGFVATCVSFLSETLSLPIVFITEITLTYIQKIVELFAGIPNAEVGITVTLLIMFIGYMLMGGGVAYIHKSQKPEVLE